MTRSVLILTLLCSFTLLAIAQPVSHSKGRKAPAFALEDINGDWVELESVRGSAPVVVDFWATWCTPCLEELAALQQIYSAYEPRGLVLLAISTDTERSAARVKPWAKSRNYTFRVLLDPNSDVARRYYVHALPTTVIIDKNGFIVYSHTGYVKGDELEVRKIIDALLTP